MLAVPLNLHPLASLPWEKSLRNLLNSRLAGHEGRSGRLGKETNVFALLGNEP